MSAYLTTRWICRKCVAASACDVQDLVRSQKLAPHLRQTLILDHTDI
jgi:hypothetical protein